MVPLEGLTLEHYCDHDCENCQGNHFLDDFQLHDIEGTAVLDEADSVGWDLGAVFEEGYAPREEDDHDQGPA